jgi:hypothetical protein
VSETDIAIQTVLDIDDRVTRSTGGEGFGVTRAGFLPKPFARLLAEKLALARSLFGDDLDLGSGSAIRKLLEISALEDARGWAALAAMYDDSFVSSASGAALSRLGDELGIPRPHLEARGTVKLALQGTLPASRPQLTLPRGARLSTPGGHHVVLEETVILSGAAPERVIPVAAFYPGPSHDLDPAATDTAGGFPQKIDRWNRASPLLAELVAAEREANAELVLIDHSVPLTGGSLGWPDARYRQLLLSAPRSIWTVEAVELAVSLVPGVRQVQVRDAWGGLDINQSIFGNFNFVERLFGSERDLGSPYYFNVLVAPTAGAVWDGPMGLRIAVESAIEDLRPISIFPRMVEGTVVSVGVQANVIARGLPLPSGSRAAINASPAGAQIKARLIARLRQYMDSLRFGEPVRVSQVAWVLLNEPGIADVQDLQLLRFPAHFEALTSAEARASGVETLACGTNLPLGTNEIPVLVEDPDRLTIV